MKTSKGHLSDAVRAGVSLREFAAVCGKSHVWVKNKCDEGLIPRYDDGSIPLEEGMAAFNQITPATLGRPKKGEVRAPAPKREPVTIKAPKKAQKKEAAEPKPVPSEETPAPPPFTPITTPEVEEPDGPVSIAQAFNRAKLDEKQALAKLRDLEYRQKKGELVERAVVEADAAAVGAAIRDSLMAIAPRLAGRCEGRPMREIEELIEDAVNEALAGLQKSEFIKGE